MTEWGLRWLLGLLVSTGFVVSYSINLLMLPGNWVMVGVAALLAWLVPSNYLSDVHGSTVGIMLALALLGELVEGLATVGTTAGRGSSRRAAVLAFIGAMLGSLVGVTVGLPLPVLGSAVAAVFGGAMGAFVGAALGEGWKGRPAEHGLEVGRAAFLGRLLGTTGKLVVGVVILAVALADQWFY